MRFDNCSLCNELRLAILWVLLPILVACSPATRFDAAADARGLVREELSISKLPVVIYRDKEIRHSGKIHIYLDGDGKPWIGGKRVALDPTTRSKLILDMMAVDTADKILIGRPCYYIKASERPAACTDTLWTSHRYSNIVVSAVRNVITLQLEKYQPEEVILIGYSGGGTLAALIASQLAQVDTLVTVAANLNVDAWSELHGYTPLARSLNEKNFPKIPDKVKQYHFVGMQDSNVPPSITRSVASLQRNVRVIEQAGYTHECCWPENWASTLGEISN